VPPILSIFSEDIFPIFAVAAAGFLLARRAGVNVKTVAAVSFFALSPSLVFTQFVTTEVSFEQSWRVAAFCVLLTAALGIAGRLLTLALRLDRQTTSSFLLVVMFSNSGNYALPVVLFAFGREALAFANVYFVTSAVLVYTCGVVVAASGRVSVKDALVRLTRVPALYAVAAAILVIATGVTVPLAIMRPVTLLSDAAIPVMILVLGMQLERATMPEHPVAVAAAVALSLFVAPLLAFGLTSVMGIGGAARQAAIVEASMPAAVVTTVLSIQFELDGAFATSVVMASTLLSPLTLVFLIAYLQR
jgi:predicted permease